MNDHDFQTASYKTNFNFTGEGDHMMQDDSDTAPSEEGYETCDSGVNDDLSSTNPPQPRTQKQR